MSENIFTVEQEQNNTRLDVFLSDALKVSRAQVQKLITQSLVTVNGAIEKKNYSLSEGDSVHILEPSKTTEERVELPELDIVAKTSDYLIINKPSGVVVHPDNTHPEGTSLIDLILASFPEIAAVGDDPTRPGVVHRLDKPVSGVMVVARTQAMFEHIKQQFKSHLVRKQYIALVHGNVDLDSDAIEYTISRKKTGFMAAHTDQSLGKEAHTDVEVVTRFPNSTLIHAFPKTGRTHQIRVHLFAYGHPIVGDPVYSNARFKRASINNLVTRPFLHAHSLSFTDLAGKQCFFEVELDSELQKALDTLNTKHQKWLYAQSLT